MADLPSARSDVKIGDRVQDTEDDIEENNDVVKGLNKESEDNADDILANRNFNFAAPMQRRATY